MALCLDKSAELAVFNDWTKRCLAYLEENRSNQYPKNYRRTAHAPRDRA
jgi:hypothetical protein